MFRSELPSWRKIRIGFGSYLRMSVGYTLPPRRPTYVPIELKTRRKESGRSQAAVNAAIAPLLAPAMQRSLPSFDSRIARPSAVFLVSTSGKSSSSRNRT